MNKKKVRRSDVKWLTVLEPKNTYVPYILRAYILQNYEILAN